MGKISGFSAQIDWKENSKINSTYYEAIVKQLNQRVGY